MKKLVSILREEKSGVISLFITEIVMLLFLSYVWSNPYINNINFGILDNDNSALSRTIATSLQSSENLNVCYYANSEMELEQAIKDKKIYAGIMIPQNYSIDLAGKRAPKLLVISDGTNVSIGGNAFSAVSSVLGTLNAGIQIKTFEGYGLSPSEVQRYVSNFSVVERVLYESQGSNISRNIYTVSLLLIIQIYVIRFIIPSMVTKRDAFAAAGKDDCIKYTIDFAIRILIYTFAAIAASYLALSAVRLIHGLPMRGKFWIFAVSMAAFMLNVTAFGIVWGALTKNMVHTIQLFTAITLTFMFTSGIPYPYDMMPKFLSVIIKCISPLAAMSVELKALNLKGIGWSTAYPYIIKSLPYTIFWGAAGVAIYALSVRRKISTHKGTAFTCGCQSSI